MTVGPRIDAHQLSGTRRGSSMPACRCQLAELPAHEQDEIGGGTAINVYRLYSHAGPDGTS